MYEIWAPSSTIHSPTSFANFGTRPNLKPCLYSTQSQSKIVQIRIFLFFFFLQNPIYKPQSVRRCLSIKWIVTDKQMAPFISPLEKQKNGNHHFSFPNTRKKKRETRLQGFMTKACAGVLNILTQFGNFGLKWMTKSVSIIQKLDNTRICMHLFTFFNETINLNLQYRFEVWAALTSYTLTYTLFKYIKTNIPKYITKSGPHDGLLQVNWAKNGGKPLNTLENIFIHMAWSYCGVKVTMWHRHTCDVGQASGF